MARLVLFWSGNFLWIQDGSHTSPSHQLLFLRALIYKTSHCRGAEKVDMNACLGARPPKLIYTMPKNSNLKYFIQWKSKYSVFFPAFFKFYFSNRIKVFHVFPPTPKIKNWILLNTESKTYIPRISSCPLLAGASYRYWLVQYFKTRGILTSAHDKN